MEHNDDGGGSGGGSPLPPPPAHGRGVVPLIALDPVNLKELYVWLRCAQVALDEHAEEVKQVLSELAQGVTVSDADVAFTKERLIGFKGAIGDLLQEIALEQAQVEMSGIDKSHLH